MYISRQKHVQSSASTWRADLRLHTLVFYMVSAT